MRHDSDTVDGTRTEARATAPSGARPRPATARIAKLLVFPVLLVLAAAALGLAGFSGSSIAIHGGADEAAEPTVGRARSIRSDEFLIRTPLVVRQAEQGFPRESQVGVGPHDMGVQSDLPTSGWQTAVRPHHLPYRLFGVETAFALEWWVLFLLLPALGTYALLLICRVGIRVSALLGLAVALSPAVIWWTVPASGTSIGYGSLGAAAVVAALRVRSTGAAVVLGATAGWMAVCFAVVLYPPWLIPVGLIVGALVAALVVAEFPWDRPPRRAVVRVLVVGGVALAVAVPLLLAFLVDHRDALAAMANSVYPGQRRRSGGAGRLEVLLGSPFDIVQSLDASPRVLVNGLNQSEAAAGTFFLAAVVAAIVAARRRVFGLPWRDWLPVVAVTVAGGVLVAWYLLPIPAVLGRPLGLDRVPSYRLLPPLSFASALSLGLLLRLARAWNPATRRRAAIAATVVFLLGTTWAAARFTVDLQSPSLGAVVVTTLLFTAAVGLIFLRERIGLPALVALLLFGACTVYPLQRGLGPLTESAAFRLGQSLRDDPRTGSVLALANQAGGDVAYLSQLTASGVDIVSTVNMYPNEAGWRVLDPDESDRSAWDRYANGYWGVAPAGSEPRVLLDTKDSIVVMVDPCGPAVAELGVRTVVSAAPLDLPCLERIRSVPYRGARLYAYRLTPADGGPTGENRDS